MPLLTILITLTTCFYLVLNAAAKRISTNFHSWPSHKQCFRLQFISLNWQKMHYQLHDWLIDWLICWLYAIHFRSVWLNMLQSILAWLIDSVTLQQVTYLVLFITRKSPHSCPSSNNPVCSIVPCLSEASSMLSIQHFWWCPGGHVIINERQFMRQKLWNCKSCYSLKIKSRRVSWFKGVWKTPAWGYAGKAAAMWTVAPPPAGCSKQSMRQQQKHGGILGAMANECRGHCRVKLQPWADVWDVQQITDNRYSLCSPVSGPYDSICWHCAILVSYPLHVLTSV